MLWRRLRALGRSEGSLKGTLLESYPGSWEGSRWEHPCSGRAGGCKRLSFPTHPDFAPPPRSSFHQSSTCGV